MADRKTVNGPALAAIALGTVFVYAGIRGKNVLDTIRSVIAGDAPASVAQAAPITAESAGVSAGIGLSARDASETGHGGAVSPQAALHAAATVFGWGSGAEWQDLQTLAMSESHMSPTERHPETDAYGMAQSNGHPFRGGPAANGINEYGGYGLTPAQSRAASMGDARWQAVWMCHYIHERYGTPSKALSKWRSRHPHWY